MWGCPPCPGFALLQVADERFCPDMMSTAKEMNVANFRRVPKMPVYGTAQPSSKVRDMHPWQAGTPKTGVPALPITLPLPQSLGSVLRYLTDAKRKHRHILWINLREEVVLEGNEQIYTLREPGQLEELIPVPTASPQQLEVSQMLGTKQGFCLFCSFLLATTDRQWLCRVLCLVCTHPVCWRLWTAQLMQNQVADQLFMGLQK